MKNTTYLGKALQQRRADRSLRDIATELKEGHTSLFYVENGRMPAPRTFLRLCQWLGVLNKRTADKLAKYADPTLNQ
jgi:hypothetical protein